MQFGTRTFWHVNSYIFIPCGASVGLGHVLEWKWKCNPLCRFLEEGLDAEYELACEHQHSCIADGWHVWQVGGPLVSERLNIGLTPKWTTTALEDHRSGDLARAVWSFSAGFARSFLQTNALRRSEFGFLVFGGRLLDDGTMIEQYWAYLLIQETSTECFGWTIS